MAGFSLTRNPNTAGHHIKYLITLPALFALSFAAFADESPDPNKGDVKEYAYVATGPSSATSSPTQPINHEDANALLAAIFLMILGGEMR